MRPSGHNDNAAGFRSASLGAFPSRRTSRSPDRVPPWWAEVGLVLGLYLAYVLTRGLQSSSAIDAARTGQALLRWEQRWHLAVEAPLNAGLQHLPAVAVLCGYFYATLHFVVTPAVLVFLYRHQPAVYRRARTALALGTGAALVGYFLLPTAPPRLLPGAGFQDTMAAVSSWGWWGGEGSAPRGFGGLTNQLAAMPSLHVGWALWSGWCLARYARRRHVRLLGATYPIATTLVVISTANHYVMDAVAGSLLVVLGWAATAAHRSLRRSASGAGVAAWDIPAPRTVEPTWDPAPAPVALPESRPAPQRTDVAMQARACACSSR